MTFLSQNSAENRKKEDVEKCVSELIEGLKIFTEYAQSNMVEEYRQLQERIDANITWEWDSFSDMCRKKIRRIMNSDASDRNCHRSLTRQRNTSTS